MGLVRAVRGTFGALCAADPRGFEWVPLAPEPGSGSRAWRHLELPRLVRRHGLVGLHAFTSGFCVRGPGWRTATVHELPWRHDERENAGFAHRLWARHGWRRAARLVTASRRTAADLAREAPRAASRIRFVPFGVEPAFFAEPLDAVVLKELQLEPGFVLIPGGARAKKRLGDALLAAAHLGQTVVVATGARTPEFVAMEALAHRLGVRLVAPGMVREDRWPGLVAAAGVVLCIARSEGFALPVVEALAVCVRPVVPPDSQGADLANGHAEIADPTDSGALAAAIERARGVDDAARAAGRAHAAGFTFERTAQGLMDVWEELI